MSDYQESFIGSGKVTEPYKSIKCTINLEDAKPFIWRTEDGKPMLTFFVSERKNKSEKASHSIKCLKK